MGFFKMYKEFKTVVRTGNQLAAMMLSQKESWKDQALAFARSRPNLFPGLLVHIRCGIDDLKIGDETRVAMIDDLGLFRDSLVAGKKEDWEESRQAVVQAMINAQRTPPRSSPTDYGKLLGAWAADPQEAAVATLDTWNVMTRQGWYTDALAMLDKVIRGMINLERW